MYCQAQKLVKLQQVCPPSSVVLGFHFTLAVYSVLALQVQTLP